MSASGITIVLTLSAFALSLLPESPFKIFIDQFSNIPFLSVLNWFVPIPEILAIGQAWLLAIATFYTISLILRWIKAIE